MKTILGSIFTAVFIAIYTNKIPSKMNEIVVPALTNAGLPASVLQVASEADQALLEKIPWMTPAILKVVNETVATAYGKSYAYVYYTAVALGVISILAAASL